MKILIDMDGVITNFVGECERVFDTKFDPWPELGNYDAMQKQLGITQDFFWKRIENCGTSFWEQMEIDPLAETFIRKCETLVSKNNIAILTSPTRDPICAYGKMRWIQKHLPRYSRQFLIGACKHICANKDTILIDDCDLNINKFQINGGKGILYPRPWNSKYADTKNGHTIVLGELENDCKVL